MRAVIAQRTVVVDSARFTIFLGTGMLVLALADLRRLLDVADLTAAMSVEALLGTDRVFAPELQALRPHPGQAVSAARMVALLAGSALMVYAGLLSALTKRNVWPKS